MKCGMLLRYFWGWIFCKCFPLLFSNQWRKRCFGDFVEDTFIVGLCVDDASQFLSRCEPISFKLAVMIDTAELFILKDLDHYASHRVRRKSELRS